MEIRSILNAIWRSPTGAILVALQTAISIAIIINALLFIHSRIEHTQRASGMDTDNIIVMKTNGLQKTYHAPISIERDIEKLQQLPEVIAVGYIDAIPLSGSGKSNQIQASMEETPLSAPINYYNVDHRILDVLGVELSSGRNFYAHEIGIDERDTEDYFPKKILITTSVAERLFPDSNAVGQTIFNSLGEASEVVGVIKLMHGAWVNWPSLENVALFPRIRGVPNSTMMLRTQSGRAEHMLSEVEKTLAADSSRLVTEVRRHKSYVDDSYQNDHAMAKLLSVVIALLFIVGALGIIALASFSVKQRTRQIGTRRAVGARQFHVLRYFFVENALMMLIGISLGATLSIALNVSLVKAFGMPVLAWPYVLAGMIAMWLVGFAAVYRPAKTAASISPVVATKNV